MINGSLNTLLYLKLEVLYTLNYIESHIYFSIVINREQGDLCLKPPKNELFIKHNPNFDSYHRLPYAASIEFIKYHYLILKVTPYITYQIDQNTKTISL